MSASWSSRPKAPLPELVLEASCKAWKGKCIMRRGMKMGIGLLRLDLLSCAGSEATTSERGRVNEDGDGRRRQHFQWAHFFLSNQLKGRDVHRHRLSSGTRWGCCICPLPLPLASAFWRWQRCDLRSASTTPPRHKHTNNTTQHASSCPLTPALSLLPPSNPAPQTTQAVLAKQPWAAKDGPLDLGAMTEAAPGGTRTKGTSPNCWTRTSRQR